MRKTILTSLMVLFLSSLNANSSYCCFDEFTFVADFLWWKAESEDFDTALDFQSIASGPNITETTYRNYSYGWRPGFKLEAITRLQLCDIVYAPYFCFTHFRATDSQNFDVAALTNQLYVLRLLDRNSISVGAGETLAYSGTTTFLYNRADLGISKAIWENCYYTLIPRVAFTYVHTRQTIQEQVITTGGNAPSIVNTSPQSLYDGYGVTLGLDADYGIGCGFSLYGDVGITALWGNWTYSPQISIRNTNTQVVTSNEGSLKSSEGRWLSDFQVGLQYHACIWKNFHVASRIGWEFVYLPDQVNFARAFDPVGLKMSGLVVSFEVGF